MKDSCVRIEVHLIQNFVPSNLNRDDTGQPKSAYFGGFRRARISSQCEKRALRNWWREENSCNLGMRTKRLQQLIVERLIMEKQFENIAGEDLWRGVRAFTDAYVIGSDSGKKQNNTKTLIFISLEEVEACVQAVKSIWGEPNKEINPSTKALKTIVEVIQKQKEQEEKEASKKSLKKENEDQVNENAQQEGAKIKKEDGPKLDVDTSIQKQINAAGISSDIALFGRMLADKPLFNTDGACQVAHPISTHKVDMEMDFYTGIDDIKPKSELGAEMMGVIGFNSACYYRYALVDRDQLARNLSGKTDRINGNWTQDLSEEDFAEADKVIESFLKAMVYAIPTGKQNSFAAQNLPSFGLFVKREKGVPVSLANAFSSPIRIKGNDEDLVGLSVEALTRHWNNLQKTYGKQGIITEACFHVGQEERLNELALSDKESVDKAIRAIMEVN